MNFLANYQLEVMLILGSFCGLMSVFCLIMDMRSTKKKISLICVELGTMVLLFADRYAYIFRGNETTLGYWMVRITNFLTFIIYYFILEAFNVYIIALIGDKSEKKESPYILTYIHFIAAIGAALVVLSQFLGFYYSFDEHNRYQREPGFIVCYLFPLLIIVLQLKAIIELKNVLRKSIFYSLLAFVLSPLVASVLQIFAYGLSLANIFVAISAIVLYLLALIDQNTVLVEANTIEIAALKKANKKTREQFEQTVLALASAIDAKDRYTHGHSRRVAEYSRRIAMEAGKSQKFCEDIYFAALLHDVGKIGVPELILNKEGRLTFSEYEAIKEHPVLGYQILNEISNSPSLSLAACCHHERYDEKGYPNGLKGEEIPELARIIAVADAYDATTSSRSYRRPLAQQKVREELVKGLRTQFDPQYALLMIHMLDKDTEYRLKDDIYRYEGLRTEIICEDYKEEFSEGIALSDSLTEISMNYQATKEGDDCIPSIVIFDSLDERVYTDERYRKEMDYTRFGEIYCLKDFIPGTLREYKVKEYKINEYKRETPDSISDNKVIIKAIKQRDHVFIRMTLADVIREYTIALMDRSHFVFIAFTGKHCKISNISIHSEETPAPEGYIKRIADEVSYITGPEGDLPNMEIMGWREQHSKGIPVKNGMKVTFHNLCLPASNRLWHSPILSLFYSENGLVKGPGFKEYSEIRFDGESWGDEPNAKNEMTVTLNEHFESWDEWKQANRKGVDCSLTIEITGNKVITEADIHNVHMKNVTKFT
ncbi:MAG: HD domain-containing protein, partial [Clostridiales bacterium]|nr:HD domain-containing protein [Candidatus Blautia equi]